MTAEEYKAKLDVWPDNDDLERVNCSRVGQPGHHFCGWCDLHNKPRFICGCYAW